MTRLPVNKIGRGKVDEWFQQRRAQSPGGSAGVCAFVLTLSAVRGSIVLGNPSWCLSYSPTVQKNHRLYKLGGGDTLLRATPSRPGVPPTSPKQPVSLDDSQPLWAPAPVRTSPPSVQQCPQPPATAFPHPQRFTAEP